MDNNKSSNLKNIFEYELKRKLSTRAKRATSEETFLINAFKFYDLNKTGKASKSDFLKVIDRIGLIGFSDNDLEILFSNYDPNKSGFIDYENFTHYLYSNTQFNPLPNNNNNLSNENNFEEIESIPFQQIQVDNPINLQDNSNNVFENSINNLKQNNYYQNEQNNISNNLYQQQQNDFLKQQDFNYQNLNNQNNKLNEYEPGNFKKYFQSLLTLFQHKININNGMTYYTFASKLKSKEDRLRKTISFEDFSQSIQETNINIDINSIFDFYNSLDLCDLNGISTDEILRVIRGNISDERKMKIIDAFARIDSNRKGFTEITYLKSLYNAKEHPEVKMGRKNENEIFGEFVYTFDIFINYKEKTSQCSFEDFIEYYSGISASIENNQYFNDMIDGVWNLQNAGDNYNNNYNNDLNQFNFQQNNNNLNFKIPEQVNFNNPNNNINNNLNNNNISNINDNYINNPYQNYNKTPYQKETPQKENNNTPNINRNTLRNTYSSRSNRRNYNLLTGEDYPEENNNIINNNNILNNNNIIYTPSYRQNQFSGTQQIQENQNIDFQRNTNINNNNIEANNAINKLRNFFLQLGSKSIFNIEKMFIMYDAEHTGRIDFQSLESIFKNYRLSLNSNEVLSIFKMLDVNNSGKINYDNLIKIIIGTMSNDRLNLIKNIFNFLGPNNNNCIHFADIKQKFIASNHPQAYSGSKSKEQIYNEFVDNLEVFKKYCLTSSISSPAWINLQDFINFYTQISFGINDDNEFNNLVSSVWGYNLQNNFRSNNNNNRMMQVGNQIMQNYNKNY